jgi:hypothetical protein
VIQEKLEVTKVVIRSRKTKRTANTMDKRKTKRTDNTMDKRKTRKNTIFSSIIAHLDSQNEIENQSKNRKTSTDINLLKCL